MKIWICEYSLVVDHETEFKVILFIKELGKQKQELIYSTLIDYHFYKINV